MHKPGAASDGGGGARAALASTSTVGIAWPRAPHVASVCFKCFICFRGMLQVFCMDVAKVDRDVAYVQWLYTYVADVCSQCFICF